MASVTIQVIVSDLENHQLDGIEKQVRSAVEAANVKGDIDGEIEEITETDREENEEES